jgi:hypothetical protein
VKLPDDDKKMSKHVGVWILYRDAVMMVYFGDINLLLLVIIIILKDILQFFSSMTIQ